MRTLAEAMAQGRGKLMHEQIVQETFNTMSPVFALSHSYQRDFLEATQKYMGSSSDGALSERIPKALRDAYTYMKGYTSISDETKQNLANALMQYNQVCTTVLQNMMHSSPQEYIDAKLYNVTPEEGKPIAAAFIDQLRRMDPSMPADIAMQQAFEIAVERVRNPELQPVQAPKQPVQAPPKPVQTPPTPITAPQQTTTAVMHTVTQRLAANVWQTATQGRYHDANEERAFINLVAKGYEQANGETPAERTPEALAYASFHFAVQQPACPILNSLDNACISYEDSLPGILQTMKVGTTEEYIAATCYFASNSDAQRIAKIFKEKLPEIYAVEPDKDVAYANAMMEAVQQLQSEYRSAGIAIPDTVKDLSSSVMDTLQDLGEDPYGLGAVDWENL